MSYEFNLEEKKVELRKYMELYCNGKSNAMTQDELAGVMDIPDPRLVRLLCQELDLEGFRVIGDNAGMYHPTDPEEEKHYANTMFSQAEKMLIRAKHHLGYNDYNVRLQNMYHKVNNYNVEDIEKQQKELF